MTLTAHYSEFTQSFESDSNSAITPEWLPAFNGMNQLSSKSAGCASKKTFCAAAFSRSINEKQLKRIIVRRQYKAKLHVEHVLFGLSSSSVPFNEESSVQPL